MENQTPNPQPAAPASAEFTPSPEVARAAQSPSMAMDLLGNLLAGNPNPPNVVQPTTPVAPAAPQGTQPPTTPVAPQNPPVPQPPVAPVATPPPPPPVSATDLVNRFSPPAAPSATAPIPDIPQEQNIQLPQNTPEHVGHAFAAARAETKQYRQLAESLKAQLEAERAKQTEFTSKETALAQQLNEANKRNADLEDKLGKLDLSQSKEFHEKYDAPLEAVQSAISSALVAAGRQQNEALDLANQILGSNNPAELLSELPATTQGMIMYKLQEAANLWAARDQALNEWRTTQQGLAQVSLRENFVNDAAHRAEVAKAAIEKAKLIAPTMQWDDPSYNGRRDEAMQKALDWYQKAPEDQIAAAAMEGFMAPFAYEVIKDLQTQVADLTNQLNGRRTLAAPPVAPYFKPPQAPAPQPAQPQTPPPGTPQAWSSAANPGDMNAAAMGLIGELLARG